MRCRTMVSGLAVLALVAGAGAAAAQQADADMKELAAYRLTKEGLDKYAVVLRTLVVELPKDPAFQEMAKLEAELERLDAKDELTAADEKRIDAIEARMEQLEGAVELSMTDGDLDDVEAQILKSRAMATAIKAGGMSAREYAKFTLALFQASMVAGMQKAGLLKELPKEISAENVQFALKHEQELQKIQQEMEALSPGGRRER